MRQMSFLHTTPQVLQRRKDVTRRWGWLNARAGEQIRAIRKGQGLKKGEHVETLAIIRVLSVRRERLSRLLLEPDYARDEMRREGFPGRAPRHFIDGYFAGRHDEFVTRIEFEYVD